MISRLFTLTLILSFLILPARLSAEVIGGIEYTLNATNKTAETARTELQYSGDIVIPAKVVYNKVTYTVTSIGWLSFYEQSNITSITIPNTVTSIGVSAFIGCTGLTSMEFPNSVTSIGSGALIDCTALRNVVIPNSVKTIEGTVFYNCSGLSSIVLPNSLTSIGERAFGGCSGISSIKIPDSVTDIGYGLFENCSGLTAMVQFPESITSIPYGTFKNCTGLTSLQIPESITSIGGTAFQGCTGVTSLEIPETITSIGNSAFQGCTALTSLEIPESIASIGNSAFQDCSNLAELKINDSSTPLSLGKAVFQSTGLTKLYIGRNFDYSFDMQTNQWAPFYSLQSLTDLTLGNNVTELPICAFDECSALASVDVSSSLTTIGPSVFDGCSALASLELPNSVNSIGEFAFRGCSSLTSLVIPANVAMVNRGTFVDCSALTSLEILGEIPTIEPYAFYGCSSLSSLKIPSSFTSIGISAFQGCSSLTSFNIPEGITTIETSTFQGCSSLSSLKIPASVTSIGESAFLGCSSLSSLELPQGVTAINKFTFANCSGLTSFLIPNHISSIGHSAFSGCSKMTEVTIADGDETLALGEYVFNYTPIKKLYLGRNYSCSSTTTNTYPFYNRASINDLTISNSVTDIPDYSFFGCTGLTAVEIPASVTSIGQRAFSTCSNLAEITLADSDKTLTFGDRVFYNVPIKKLYIGRNFAWTATNETYFPFYNYSTITDISFAGSATSVPAQAFYGCSGLSSLELANPIKSIGVSAFQGCTGLTALEIPPSVTSIGNQAFYGCSRISDITIADSDVTLALGDNVFYNNSFKTAYLGRNYSLNNSYYLSSNPFYKRTTLTKATISAQVTSVPDKAFYGCTKLTDLTLADGDETLDFGENVFTDAPLFSLYLGRNVSGSPFADNLTLFSLTISNSVDTISPNDFSGCTGLVDITIADSHSPLALSSATFRKSPVNALYLGRNVTGTAFADQTSLNNLTISDSVTLIDQQAFSGCSRLETLEIPASVTTVASRAFENCSALTKLTLAAGNSELQFGSIVFNNSPLEEIYLGRNFSGTPFSSMATLKRLNISDKVSFLPDNAFSNTGISSVLIPESVTSIGNYAFNQCSAISSITIPATVERVGIYAFGNCPSLTSLTIEDSEQALQCTDTSFLNSPLKSVYLGRSSTLSFYGSETLESVSFGNLTTTVGYNAFSNCTHLSSVTLPQSLHSISREAFSGCSSLPSITLPASLTYIGSQAFTGCSALSEVACDALTPPAAESNSFDEDTYENASLAVPEEAKNDYLAHDVWRNFKSLHILVEAIELDPSTYRGIKGDSFQIKATIIPADATETSLVWSSSNDKIAIVDQDGFVNLMDEGYCEITAQTTDGSDLKATCVIDIVSSIALIDADSLNGPFSVYNLAGKLLFTSDVKDALSQLPRGIYIILRDGRAWKFVID